MKIYIFLSFLFVFLLMACAKEEVLQPLPPEVLLHVQDLVAGTNFSLVQQVNMTYHISFVNNNPFYGSDSGLNQTTKHILVLTVVDGLVQEAIIDDVWDALKKTPLVAKEFSGSGELFVDSFCDVPKFPLSAKYVDGVLVLDAWLPDACDGAVFSYELLDDAYPPTLEITLENRSCACFGRVSRFKIPIAQVFGGIRFVQEGELFDEFSFSDYECSPEGYFSCPPGYECVFDENNLQLNGVCAFQTGERLTDDAQTLENYLNS